MALTRPPKGMKMSGRRASKVRERPAPQAVNKPQRHNPLPTPLDSGLRRNDEMRGRNDEVGAGTTNEGRIGECGSSEIRALSGPRKVIYVSIALPC